MNWLIENIGSIIVVCALAVIVTLIVISNVKNKKKGKSNCGCDCSNCSMNGICHQTEQNNHTN
ncbi:MAG: FeoB-associated Cys-rich membrane protein [Clostridia bacterium]|nr:FeoB-associated Cys-rich membrane protein [Clostridia bacterium]